MVDIENTTNENTRRPHPTVLLNYKEETVEIDEQMAPLIQAIWQAGIDTLMCCQET